MLNCLLSPCRPELYDPYDPVSPDSEHENSQDQDHSSSLFTQDDNPEPLSVKTNKSRWDIPAPATASRPPDRDDPNSRALNLGHRLPERTCDPATEPFVSPGYDSVGRSLDCRVGSPDRHILSLSNQKFPASYRPPRTNESERIFPDYRGEVLATDVCFLNANIDAILDVSYISGIQMLSVYRLGSGKPVPSSVDTVQ